MPDPLGNIPGRGNTLLILIVARHTRNGLSSAAPLTSAEDAIAVMSLAVTSG